MVPERRSLFCAVAETTEQAGKPFLKPNPMHKSVLLLLQQQLFRGIIQLSRLQLLQQLVLFSTLLLAALLIPLTTHQGRGRITPVLPGHGCLLQPYLLLRAAETIKPVPLLPRTGELLRLSLNG